MKNKTRQRPLATYFNMLSSFIAKDLADDKVQLADGEVQLGYETLYSSRTMRCYYIVTMLPKWIDTAWYMKIRKVMCDLPTKNKVFANFSVKGTPHFIDWNSRDMKARKRIWEYSERNKETTNDVFTAAEDKAKSDFESWRIQSWKYVQECEQRKATTIDCEMVVELCIHGTTRQHKSDLHLACRYLEQFFARKDIQYKKVRNQLPDFLRYTSPVCLDNTTYTAQTLPNRLLSDEILANMLSCTPGRTKDIGVLFGIDCITGMACYKNMVRSDGEAENFIVLAETGSGKSFFMKALILQMALNGFNQIVLDVDGEYAPLAKVLGGTVVNMSKSAGLYFDSTVIGNPTGNEEIDKALCIDSVTSTTSVFSLLCDSVNGMTPTEERLFNIAYTRLFEKYGINSENPATWHNSSQLSYKKLYQSICDLVDDDELMDVYAVDIRQLIDKLYVFFDKNGIRNYLFKNPISLADILNSESEHPMFLDIVLNLTTSEDGNNRETLEDSLKQITASYLITLVTNFYKSQNKFSIHYIEEYQRYSQNKRVESLVVYMITGNRKRNACTFVISNSPRMLFGSESSSNMAIIDNINNFIVGALSEGTIDSVCGQFGLANCRDVLMRISKGGDYKHAFLLQINKADTTVIRQSIPKALAETPLFATRTTKYKTASETVPGYMEAVDEA